MMKCRWLFIIQNTWLVGCLDGWLLGCLVGWLVELLWMVGWTDNQVRCGIIFRRQMLFQKSFQNGRNDSSLHQMIECYNKAKLLTFQNIQPTFNNKESEMKKKILFCSISTDCRTTRKRSAFLSFFPPPFCPSRWANCPNPRTKNCRSNSSRNPASTASRRIPTRSCNLLVQGSWAARSLWASGWESVRRCAR